MTSFFKEDVLSRMADGKPWGIAEMAAAVGKTEYQCKNLVGRLVSEGIIRRLKRAGPGRAAIYVLYKDLDRLPIEQAAIRSLPELARVWA